MGSFYKTSSAMPLDYMYQANIPLMERVLKANDDYITQNLQQANKLETAAVSFPYLQPDSNRAKAIGDDYSKRIDDITSAIRNDPAKWRKQLTPIRDISRQLQSDYSTGEISKISSNYNKYKKVSDFIDAQVTQYGKTGKGISGDRAKAYKAHFLKTFTEANPNGTGYNKDTGEYNEINTFEPMANIDVRKLLGEELDKLKADKTKYQKDEVTGKEWYFNDKTKSWEGITPEKILGIVSDRLNNPQLQDYLRQDTQVGLIKGVYDENGRFINPYTHVPIPPSMEEAQNVKNIQEQIEKTKDPAVRTQLQTALESYQQGLAGRKSVQWNRDSYLAPIMRGLVNQYSYNQTEEADKLRNNSKGQTQYVQGQTNARQTAQLKQAKEIATEREKGINDRFKQRLDFDKYKWDNPQTKKTTTGTGTKKVTAPNPTDDLKNESTVSRLSTNSFEDWTTVDANGQTVKVLSTQGLAADVDNIKTQLNSATNESKGLESQMSNLLGNRKITDLSVPELAAYTSLEVKKNALDKNIPKLQSDLNARRKWYQGSVEAALNNNPAALKDDKGDAVVPLSAEEIALYNKYSPDREGSKKKKDIAELEKQYPWIPDPNQGAASKARAGVEMMENPVVTKEKKELADYLSVKKKVDERRDNFLAQIRYTPIDTDAINVGKEDSEAIGKMLFTNPQGLKMFDNTGNRADNITLEGKGISFFAPKADNYNMSLADDSRNFINYMTKHNVTPVIEQVGNTTKIGSGNAVVKVTFNDPNGEIPKTPFYIELTPEMQKQVATRMAINKNEDVKKIANDMLDGEANDIRRQLITPTMQRTSGAADNYDPVTFTIFIGNGNQRIPFQVTKFAASDGSDHLNITGSVNGVQTPLPNTQSGIPGWFNGAEDFINYIKTQRNSK